MFLRLSIGLFFFLVLNSLNMNNLPLDFSYIKLNVFIILFKCSFIFLYHMNRVIKYYVDLSLIKQSFMRSLLGYAL